MLFFVEEGLVFSKKHFSNNYVIDGEVVFMNPSWVKYSSIRFDWLYEFNGFLTEC